MLPPLTHALATSAADLMKTCVLSTGQKKLIKTHDPGRSYRDCRSRNGPTFGMRAGNWRNDERFPREGRTVYKRDHARSDYLSLPRLPVHYPHSTSPPRSEVTMKH